MLRQLMLLLGAAVSSFFWTSMSILIAFVLFEIQLKLSAKKIEVKSLFLSYPLLKEKLRYYQFSTLLPVNYL